MNEFGRNCPFPDSAASRYEGASLHCARATGVRKFALLLPGTRSVVRPPRLATTGPFGDPGKLPPSRDGYYQPSRSSGTNESWMKTCRLLPALQKLHLTYCTD